MIEIHLHEVDCRVTVVQASGLRDLQLVDPRSGIIVRVQMPEEGAKQLAHALTDAKLVVADSDDLARLTEGM